MQQVYLKNMSSVSDQINLMVRNLECSYMEACLLYCEERNIEVEQLAMIIKKNSGIKAHLQSEATELNMLKKEK